MEQIFAISEVTELTGINESTLRNWEREFSHYVTVSRDAQGARIYTQPDIQRFKRIHSMRKKGLSIGAIKDLLSSFQQGENLSMDEALRVVAVTEMIPQSAEQIKVLTALEVLQTTLQQLPEQIGNRIKQELHIHQEQITKQVEELVESRLEKFQKKKKPWWRF